jgi:hypothetical protein
MHEETGAPPDFYSFRPLPMQSVTREEVQAAITSMIAEQMKNGSTFPRVTLVDDGVWLEGWRVRPQQQAAFNPPTVPA